MSNEYQLRNPNGSVIRIFPGAAEIGRGGRFEQFRHSLVDAALEYRIAEAQQRLNAAKDGDVVQIDADLEPFINRTEK
jgi:hypothetical protein